MSDDNAVDAGASGSGVEIELADEVTLKKITGESIDTSLWDSILTIKVKSDVEAPPAPDETQTTSSQPRINVFYAQEKNDADSSRSINDDSDDDSFEPSSWDSNDSWTSDESEPSDVENIELNKGNLTLWFPIQYLTDALLAVWKNDMNALKAAVEKNLHVGQGKHPAATLQLALMLRRSLKMIRELLTGEGKNMVNMKLKKSFGKDPRESTTSRLRYSYPLNEAVECEDEKRSLQLVRVLLQNGADVNRCSYGKSTPIETAIETKKWDALNVLLDLDIDLRSALNYPLKAAVLAGDLPLTKLLLQKGADPARCDAIVLAAEAGNADAVKLLLELGAYVNETDHLCRTPLHLAVESGHSEVLNLLIQNGVDLEVTNARNLKAMQVAAEAGNAAMMKTLIGHGAQFREEFLECDFHGPEVVRLMLEHFPHHPQHKRNLIRLLRFFDTGSARAYFEAGVELSAEEAEAEIELINEDWRQEGCGPRQAAQGVSPEGKQVVQLINEFVPFAPLRPKLKHLDNVALSNH